MGTDIEQARVKKGQGHLFPFIATDVCRSMGLNKLTAMRLYKNGFLSFNPATVGDLDCAQVAELEFLGSLVIAGCDKRMLQHLLRYLTKPYQFRLKLMYYDWLSQRWLLLPPREEEEEEDPFEDWLDML